MFTQKLGNNASKGDDAQCTVEWTNFSDIQNNKRSEMAALENRGLWLNNTTFLID